MNHTFTQLKPSSSDLIRGSRLLNLLTVKQVYIFLITLILLFLLSGCTSKQENNKQSDSNQVMTLSVSSDGQYVITVNANRRAYIWNIEDKSHKELRIKPVNIYSAFFIPDSHNILIQNDQTNEVYIEDVAGNNITTFNPGFATYGQAIGSNLTYWAGADEAFNLYLYNTKTQKKKRIKASWCIGDHKGKAYQGKLPHNCSGFAGYGSLMGLKFTPDNHYLIETDMGRLFVYDLQNMKASWYQKNTGQTSNAISPNGQYVITIDSNGKGYKYNLESKTGQHFASVLPIFTKDQGNYQWRPQTSINFITDNNYLVTYQGHSKLILYVGLYDSDDIKMTSKLRDYPANYPIEALPLVKYPNAQYPADNGLYPQTQSFLPVVDTSPSAHMLVMAQANGGGIMVYQYHPDEQSLELIWAPTLKDE